MKTSNAEHPRSNVERLAARCDVGNSRFSRTSLVAPFLLRVCAKSITGHEAHFEQNDPHPDPLPSDGRGNSQTRLSQLPKRLDTPTDRGRFSLSHPMGEGRSEGELAPESQGFMHEFFVGLASPVQGNHRLKLAMVCFAAVSPSGRGR